MKSLFHNKTNLDLGHKHCMGVRHAHNRLESDVKTAHRLNISRPISVRHLVLKKGPFRR
jgi:hypothetical protein